jgi:hypothetical protein
MLGADLLPVDGEAFELKTANKQDDARSDIRAEGFWGKKRRAFFDVMVFTPFARSYSTRSLKAIYAEHEGRKNREYKERILKVERADFTPLVFSLTGGMGPQAQASSDDWVACWLSVRRCRSQISWDGSVLDCRSQSCALLSHACVGVGA